MTRSSLAQFLVINIEELLMRRLVDNVTNEHPLWRNQAQQTVLQLNESRAF